jgi:hypothetical protein
MRRPRAHAAVEGPDYARERNRTVVDVAGSVAEGHALLPRRGE